MLPGLRSRCTHPLPCSCASLSVIKQSACTCFVINYDSSCHSRRSAHCWMARHPSSTPHRVSLPPNFSLPSHCSYLPKKLPGRHTWMTQRSLREGAFPCTCDVCASTSCGVGGVTICGIILSFAREGVAVEYALVSLGLHCFLQLAHALYCRSGRCLATVAFSV